MIASFVSSTARFRIATLFAMLALPILMVSCGQPEAIQISVIEAVLIEWAGRPAMDIYLDTKSKREFALFTTKYVGHSVEVSFRDAVLNKVWILTPKVQILTPIDGGILQISMYSNRGDDTLNESNAADVVAKLSTGDTKVQVRVVD